MIEATELRLVRVEGKPEVTRVRDLVVGDVFEMVDTPGPRYECAEAPVLNPDLPEMDRWQVEAQPLQ